jgi:hypothetical protein
VTRRNPEQRCSDREVGKGRHHVEENNEKDANCFEEEEEEEEEDVKRVEK